MVTKSLAYASGTLKTDAPHDGPGIPYFTDQGIAGAKVGLILTRPVWKQRLSSTFP